MEDMLPWPKGDGDPDAYGYPDEHHRLCHMLVTGKGPDCNCSYRHRVEQAERRKKILSEALEVIESAGPRWIGRDKVVLEHHLIVGNRRDGADYDARADEDLEEGRPF